MKTSLAGKVVLVTGASRGLGRAIALEFARRGAKLALGARSEDALDQTRRQVASALAQGPLARVLLMSTGKTYHEAINAEASRQGFSDRGSSRLSEARR